MTSIYFILEESKIFAFDVVIFKIVAFIQLIRRIVSVLGRFMKAAAISQKKCTGIDHIKLALAVKVEGASTRIGYSTKLFVK